MSFLIQLEIQYLRQQTKCGIVENIFIEKIEKQFIKEEKYI